MSEQFSAEAVVIGAGVVGLAVARALAQAGRDVVILEKNAHIGRKPARATAKSSMPASIIREARLKAGSASKGATAFMTSAKAMASGTSAWAS